MTSKDPMFSHLSTSAAWFLLFTCGGYPSLLWASIMPNPDMTVLGAVLRSVSMNDPTFLCVTLKGLFKDLTLPSHLPLETRFYLGLQRPNDCCDTL